MITSGVVRVWHDDEGWGVIDSPETPGGCWAHYSCVLVPGCRSLRAGESVTLDYESFEQDGYPFRANELWPAGQEPYRTEPETGSSEAYSSTVTITSDDPETPESTEARA